MGPIDPKGANVLRYPAFHVVLALFGFLLAVAIGAGGASTAPTLTGKAAFLAFGLVFGLLGVYLFLSWKNELISYDDTGITFQSAFRRIRRIAWGDITEISYLSRQGRLKIRDNTGKIFSVNYVRKGFKGLVDALRQHANPAVAADLQKYDLAKRPTLMGVDTNPITESAKAIREKESAAEFLVGLAFLQFVLALGLFIFAFVIHSNTSAVQDALGLTTLFAFSSLTYVVAGSILFKFNSRIFGVLVFLFAFANMISAFLGGVQIGSLFIYGLITWYCGRAAYGIFLIHQKWPDALNTRHSYPKWFHYLYWLMIICVIAIVALFVYAKVYAV